MAGVAGMTAHIPNADAKICGSAAMGRIRICGTTCQRNNGQTMPEGKA